MAAQPARWLFVLSLFISLCVQSSDSSALWASPKSMLKQGATEVLGTVTNVNVATDNSLMATGTVSIRIDKVLAGRQTQVGAVVQLPFTRRHGAQDNPVNWELLAPNTSNFAEAIYGASVIAFLSPTTTGVTQFPSDNAIQSASGGGFVGTISAVDNSSNRTISIKPTSIMDGYVPGAILTLAYPVLPGTPSDRYVNPVIGKLVYVGFTDGTITDMEALTEEGLAKIQDLDTQLIILVGDVNQDGIIDCSDVALIRGAFGKTVGTSGYSGFADLNNDGVVDIRDLAIVTSKLPAGTVCQ